MMKKWAAAVLAMAMLLSVVPWSVVYAADEVVEQTTMVETVEGLIDAIGEVSGTPACKEKIDAAERAYNALSADQQALVRNVQALMDAKEAYGNLAVVRFVDVPKHAWFADDVEFVVEKGIMSGTASNMFSPNSTTTRGMLVSMLYNLEGRPAVDRELRFSDVDAWEWFVDGVCWASANGIVSGYEDGTFRPYDKITREEMATFLHRYAAYKGYELSADVDLSGYADADQIGVWAKPSMEWANAQGLIAGLPDHTMNPGGTAIRAQVAAIMTRFCENIM